MSADSNRGGATVVDGRNGYTPPADYKAPDFVRQWADTASRGADRIEQEREQRARDGQRDAEQRAQDGQRALAQSSQDAQRAAGQAARDAQRAAEQIARDEGRAATSTAARATYDLDRVGEGAQRGLAYSHGSANEALLRRRAQLPAQAPSPAPNLAQATASNPAPVPPPVAQPTTPGVHPTPAVPKSRAAKGPAAKNAAHLGQPGLGAGFAVFAGLAAVVSAFLGYWIPVVIAIMFSAGPIRRGFTFGAKGIAAAVLAILLLAAAAGIQILQVLPGASGSDEAQVSAETTPIGLEGDAIETDPLPELTLEPGAPLSGYGEANIEVVLPAGAGQLAVLDVVDTTGDLAFTVANPQATEHVEFGTGTPNRNTQWLVNTEGAAAQVRGEDPAPAATNNIQVISGGEWSMTILPIDALPAFDSTLAGEGAGLHLYTGAGGEAAITAGDYGKLQIYTHGAALDLIQSELPATETRAWQPGPMVVEVAEAKRIDGTPLPWSIEVAQP